MSLNNANVFNCSLTNYDNALRRYGKGVSTELNLIKLLYKYACYSPTEAGLNRLDSMISTIQMESPTICMDKLSGDFFYGLDGGGIPTGGPDPDDDDDPVIIIPNKNNPPTIDDYTINITEDISVKEDTSKLSPVPIYTLIHTMDVTEFLTNFNDVDGDSYSLLEIRTLPASLQLRINNDIVQVGDIINLRIYPSITADVGTSVDTGGTGGTGSNLTDTERYPVTIWKINSGDINETFTYRINDDNVQEPAWSSDAIITVLNSSSDNQAATTGDTLIKVDNNVTTVLVSTFFTDTDPAYSDPESDPLDSIRIDSISRANTGQYLYLGVAVTAGQVISKASLDGGDFTHIGTFDSDISTDSLEFSLRDSGSLIWVS